MRLAPKTQDKPALNRESYRFLQRHRLEISLTQNPFRSTDRGVKQIPLTRGQTALVDDEDFERVSKFKWHYVPYRNTGRGFARRSIGLGPKKKICQQMHRFILGMPQSRNPKVDHRDLDALNNQKQNLRICDSYQNGQNRSTQAHSAPFKGVHWNKRSGKFTACINVIGKRIFLGYFNDPIEAAEKYDAAALLHFGEFARPNFKQGVDIEL